MKVDLLIPWTPGCMQRERLLTWTIDRYADVDLHDVHLGASPAGPFNRAAAILDAAAKSDADVYVISDADVYCDPWAAIAMVNATGWAVPHTLIHRLSKDSTEKVLFGADWRGLPLSTDNNQDRYPYRGNETGTLFVIRADVLADVPLDVRFVGWGHEDTAHAMALNTLVGPCWRGDDDLVHMWHPPQERLNRRVGNRDSKRLENRYRHAHNHADAMRALVDESRLVAA